MQSGVLPLLSTTNQMKLQSASQSTSPSAIATPHHQLMTDLPEARQNRCNYWSISRHKSHFSIALACKITATAGAHR